MEGQQLIQLARDVTKESLQADADSFVEQVLENGKVLEAAEGLKALEEFVKRVRGNDKFVSYCRDEISKYGKRVETGSGTKIEICENGTKYHYDRTNDHELFNLMEEKEKLELKIKERQEFLQKLPTSGLEVRRGDELITLYPPYKTSESSYKVTLAK